MKKLMGGTLVLALTSLGWAAPQTSTTPDTHSGQTTKQTGKKAKRAKKHSRKSTTPPTSQPTK